MGMVCWQSEVLLGWLSKRHKGGSFLVYSDICMFVCACLVVKVNECACVFICLRVCLCACAPSRITIGGMINFWMLLDTQVYVCVSVREWV